MSAATRHLIPEVPDEARFTEDAAGRPVLRAHVLLDETDAGELNAWLAARSAEVRRNGWEGWTVADSVIRTICVQIDSFGPRAFAQRPGTTKEER